ncbi:MAG: diaminopimelate epimerase [Thermoproteota archaeon]
MKFWKMHGTGNDYIMMDNRDHKLAENEIPRFTAQVCKRRFSVGSDGLLLLYDSYIADVKMRMFNPDGTEAEMCGNGIGCFAKYCYEKGVTDKEKLKVETLAGVKTTWLSIRNGEVKSVKVNMGKPLFDRSSIPMTGEGKCINDRLKVDHREYVVTCLSVGNPHCVLLVDNVDGFPVRTLGPKIENHEDFLDRTNVEFVQILNPEEIKVRVWERGVGETLACGTGACATVAACYTSQETDDKVTVHLPGGDLKVLYRDRIFLEGPAVKAYIGQLS